jgi:hypothetical protein
MDPAELAAGAVSLLVAYFSRNKDELVDRAGDAVVGGLGRLYRWIADLLRKEPRGEVALDALAETPEDARRQGAVEFVLTQLVERDEETAWQLTELVAAVGEQHDGGVRVTDSGAVSLGDQLITGTYVAGRDLTIGSADDDKR